MRRNNPWLEPPDYAKPLECPFHDAGRGSEGGGWEGPSGQRSNYWDTTVARKHGYWKQFDMPKGTKDIRSRLHSAIYMPRNNMIHHICVCSGLREDLLKYGYCIVEDAMSPGQLAFIHKRLDEQARAEREVGLADMSPFFHIMWTLVNKGDCFAKLVEFSPEWCQAGPVIERLNEEMLGEVIQYRKSQQHFDSPI